MNGSTAVETDVGRNPEAVCVGEPLEGMVDCTELCLGGRAELTGRVIEFLDDLEAGGVARGDDNSGTSFRGTGNGTSICVDPEIYLAAGSSQVQCANRLWRGS